MGAYLPEISLAALAVAVVIAIIRNTNVGALALGLALVVGYYLGGVKMKDILAGYPVSLFIMLAGVTYLFAIAQVNGTLEKLTKLAIKSVRGNVALLPIVLFFLAFGLSSMGPGSISVSALLAAPVMLLAAEVAIPPLLMALMVANGAQAGMMSPIATSGVIVGGVLQKMNITGWNFTLWMNMLVTHFAVGIAAYLLFGGLKLLKRKDGGERTALKNIVVEPFTLNQYLTLAGIAVLIVGVMVFKLDIGLGAFLIGSILSLIGVADEGKAFKAMPWGAITMVTGISVLISLMSKIGGMDLFAGIIAKFSTPFTATLVVGFLAALISAYASTTGVILPSFLPMAPVFLEKVGGGELLALVSTIIVAGHLTDVSPLSTIGAIFLANAGPNTDKNRLFRHMLYWGMAMSVVGAVICWLFFTVLRIP